MAFAFEKILQAKLGCLVKRKHFALISAAVNIAHRILRGHRSHLVSSSPLRGGGIRAFIE